MKALALKIQVPQDLRGCSVLSSLSQETATVSGAEYQGFEIEEEVSLGYGVKERDLKQRGEGWGP